MIRGVWFTLKSLGVTTWGLAPRDPEGSRHQQIPGLKRASPSPPSEDTFLLPKLHSSPDLHKPFPGVWQTYLGNPGQVLEPCLPACICRPCPCAGTGELTSCGCWLPQP